MYTGKEEANPQDRLRKMEKHAENLISASVNLTKCRDCKDSENSDIIRTRTTDEFDSDLCLKCEKIKKRVIQFNTHNCGFSCHKKKKLSV
jgi:hypothetical protein